MAEDRHVVAVEESPADAEEHHGPDGGGEVPGVTQPQQRRHKQERPDGAGVNAPAWRGAHPRIGHGATRQHASQRPKLDVAGRGESGRTFFEFESVGEKCWQPVFRDPTRDGWQGEIDHQEAERRLHPQRAQGVTEGHRGFLQ